MADLKNALLTGAKVGTAVLGTAVGLELTALGANMLQNDYKVISSGVKELQNPTPIKMKKRRRNPIKNLFAKTEVNKINPFTGKIESYTGTRKPVNKKTVWY